MTLPTLKFDEEFFKEEIRWDYTVSAEMKKVWAVELDMLQKLLDVCKKYGLNIYADGGTLLGAIRHKGFIPWDDDIDMLMMREDYEKLVSVALEEFQNPYFFQCYKTDENWYRGFAKLRNSNTYVLEIGTEQGLDIKYNQGIFIDIFPYDRIPKSKIRLNITRLRLTWENICISNSTREISIKSWRAKLLSAILNLFDYDIKKMMHEFEKTATKYKNKDCAFIGPLIFLLEDKYIKELDWYSKVELMNFENIRIPVPCGYKEILSRQYGDYMNPVKGTALHQGLFFDTEKSYLEYRENKYGQS